MSKKLLILLVLLMAAGPAGGNGRASAEFEEYVTPVAVLFVHGFNDSAKSWEDNAFYQQVQYQYASAYAVNYGPEDSYNDIASPSIYEERMNETLRKLKPGQKIDIVVHSMGGLLVRWYLLQHRNDEEVIGRVRKVIFLQTPNHGSPIAFTAVMQDMIEKPDLYGLSRDPNLAAYRGLYDRYIEDYWNVPGKAMTFEKWLTQDEEGKRALEAITDQNPDQVAAAGWDLNLNSSYPPKADTTERYRYSESFHRYAVLMYARYVERMANWQKSTKMVDVKAYPGPGELNELEDSLIGHANAAQDIVMNRLMLEWFYLFTEKLEDGKEEYARIISNPFLNKLNREEYEYRKARVTARKYVPQYITVATSATVAGKGTQWLADIGVWGKTKAEKQNDLVVPVSSVAVPPVLLDRNVVLDGSIAHTSFSWKDWQILSDLRGQPDLFSPQFFHPLTGADDGAVTLTLDPSTSGSLTGDLVALKNSPLKPKKGKYRIQVKFEESGSPELVLIKRDKDQAWQKMSPIPLRFDGVQYQASFELEVTDKESDYLLVPLKQGSPRADGKITVRYTSMDDGTAAAEDPPVYPYLIKPIDANTGQEEKGFITQRFRVFDARTGQPVNRLSLSDFIVADNGKKVDGNTVYFWNTTRKVRAGSNVMLTLDYSGSMEGEPLVRSQAAAKDFIRGIKSDVNIGVTGFASEIRSLYPFTASRYKAASKSVYTDQIRGGTALYDAIRRSALELSGQKGQRTLILMTDGTNTEGQTDMEQALQAAIDNQVQIYTVGLGGDLDRDTLNEIAFRTGGQPYYVYDQDKLSAIYKGVTEVEDGIYTLIYPKQSEETEHVGEIRMTSGRSNRATFPYAQIEFGG